MLNYESCKKQALQIFQQLSAFAERQGEDDQAKTLQTAMSDLQTGQLAVVVCGEFKRGKSSFINALLNEKDICPVDIDITTSLVTTIEYGERERISVVVGEDAKPTVLPSRVEIPYFVTEQGNPDNERGARLMQIQLPNAQLKSGLILVDTPGVGGLNKAHTSITYAFLPSADVVIFVSDALEPLTVDELRFLEQRIVPHCQNILFVVTKMDKNALYQKIIDDNRQKLTKVLKRPAQDIAIIPVSNLAKKDYITSKDKEDLQESNFEQLENYLWYYLHNGQGSILLLNATQALTTALAELRLPLQTELLGCQEQDRQAIEREKERIGQIRERLQELLDQNATWQYHLQDELDTIQSEAHRQLQEGFNALRNILHFELDNAEMRKNPSLLVDKLQNGISDLLITIYNNLGQAASEVHNRLKEETGLNLNPYRALTDATHSVALSQPTNEYSVGLWDQTVMATSSAIRDSETGGNLLSVIGGVAGLAANLLLGMAAPVITIGFTLGGLLGSLIGFGSGAKRSVNQQKDREKMALNGRFLAILSQQEAYQSGEIRTVMKQVTRTMRDDLTAKLTRERRSSEEALRNLERSSKLDQEQRVARIRELTIQLQQFDNWQSQVNVIADEALEAQKRIKDILPTSNSVSGLQTGSGATKNENTGDWADE